MQQSYLQRAQQWIQSGDDIDVNSIQSTISRFSQELTKLSNSSSDDHSKMQDLEFTIEFLQQELVDLQGPDELLKKTAVVPLPSKQAPTESYTYDSSSLADNNEDLVETLSPQQKVDALKKVMDIPGVSLGEALVKKPQ